jgi:hypothetical protein
MVAMTPNPFKRNRLQTSDTLPESSQQTTVRPKRGRPCINYPATTSPTIKDIGKLAGFFDGEGHVTSKLNELVVQINQNDRETLDWMQARIGGRVYGPYIKKATGNIYHYLILSKERALGFMFTIFTDLPTDRREQFKAALAGKPQRRIYKQAFTSNGVNEAYFNREFNRYMKGKNKTSKRQNAMSLFMRRFEK